MVFHTYLLTKTSAEKGMIFMQFHEVYFSNLNIVCNSGGYFAPARDEVWAITPHMFSQNKFYYITKGTCRLSVDGKDYCPKGRLGFYPCRDGAFLLQFPGRTL